MEIQAPDKNIASLLNPQLNKIPLPATPTHAPTMRPDLDKIPLPPSGTSSFVSSGVDSTFVSQGDPQQEFLTQTAERQAMLDSIVPTLQGDRNPETHNYNATMAESIKRAVIDDGLTSNLVRWIDQQHASIADPDPVQANLIREAMPELMAGLAPSDVEYLSALPTLELAEREAERLRQQYWWQQATEDDGFLKGMVAGIGGFILDPLNLVPGAMLLKGTALTTKAGMAIGRTGGGMSLAKGSIGANVAKWGTFGIAEEIIRAYPRLQADPTFREREYWESIMYAGGFGAAIPALPILQRAAGSAGRRGAIELENAYKNISNSSAGISLAQNLRTANNVLADLDTSSAKAFRKQDKGQLWQTKKEETLKKQDASGRNLKGKSYKEATGEAREAFTNGKYNELGDEGVEAAAEALIKAGVMTKEAGEAFVSGLKTAGKITGDVAKVGAKVGEKVIKSEPVKAAGRKLKENAKKELEGAKDAAKGALHHSVQSLLHTDQILTNLAKSTAQGAKNLGPIARDLKKVMEKVSQKQNKLDAESNPDIKRQSDNIKRQAAHVEEVAKKAEQPTKMKGDFTVDDVSGPNSISKPDVRGELKEAVETLDRMADSFGADTAGAARVKRSRWEQFKEEARSAKERAIYEARQGIEDIAVKRDATLAALPEATSDELRKNIKYMFDQQIDALNRITDINAERHGVRPRQQEIPTANEQVMGTMQPAYREALDGFKKLDARIYDIAPNSKNVGIGERLTTGYQDSLRNVLVQEIKVRKLDARNTNLYTNYGLMSGFEQVIDQLPNNKAKAKMMQRMSDEFEKTYSAIREDISLEDLRTRDIDDITSYLDSAIDHVAGKLNTMEAQFLSPLENTLYVNPAHQKMSEDFQRSGWQPLIEEQFVNNKRNQAIANQAGGLTHSMQSQILASGAPLQQNLGLRLFETSAGFGGDRIAPTNTAAIVANNLHNEVHVPYLRAYDTFQKEWAKEQGWSWLQEKKNYKGHSEGYQDIARMNETLMIAQNNRRLGKPETHNSPAVSKMLEATDAAYAKLHDMQIESGIEGITRDNQIKHHQKQVWNDEKILQMTSAPGGVEAMTELIQKGLQSAGFDEAGSYTLSRGFLDAKHADLHAPRLGGNQKLNEQVVNGAMPSIMKITDQMRKRGVDEQQISQLTAALNETVGNVDGPGYINHQLKIDYEATVNFNGKEVRVVDMLDLDAAGHLERQSKESTALVAINDAFDGKMNSYQAIEDYITSAAKEAHGMGAKNLSREIRNGIGMLTGTEYDGQLPKRMRMIRGHLQLTSMGGLMESQLAEAGLSIARGSASLSALKQYKDSMKGSKRLRQGRDENALPPAIRENTELIKEMESIGNNYQDMYALQRNNVVFDAEDLGMRGDQLQGLDKGLDIVTGGKYRPAMHSAQSYLTGFGKIRGAEESIAQMSVLNDMARRFIDPKTGELRTDGGGSFTSEARWKDMGLDTSEQSTIRKLFDPYEGHIRVDEKGNVTRLNVEDWSAADKRTMGVILSRDAGRQIQKGFVGETSPVLMNPWWGFLTQFRSYTMIAAEKQQVRNMKFADKEMANGMVLNAATSAISRMVRIQSLALSKPMDDREEYRRHKLENIGYETMKYMAMASMIPELSAMINQVVGQPFGTHPHGEVRGGEDLVPALSYFQRLMKAQQDGIPTTDAERGRLQALIQLGTIKQANVLFGLLRTALDD